MELFVKGYGEVSNKRNSEVGMECRAANVEGCLSNFSEDFRLESLKSLGIRRLGATP